MAARVAAAPTGAFKGRQTDAIFGPAFAATAGADGAMRLHHVNTLTAIKMLEPADGALYSVRWSASRPMVLAAGALDGRVGTSEGGRRKLWGLGRVDVVLVTKCLASFFGEAAVLGYPSRLETIITTRSSTMMTLRHQDMNELCQLSSEFKAELMIIAMERIRRSKMNREVAGFALREFGLDPNEVIVGSDQGEFQEVDGRVILRSLSDLGEPVKYVDDWKELVSERVGLSVVASMPKILQSIKHLDKHISVIEDRVEALDGKKAAQSSTFSRGKLASPSEDPHGATVSARLEALETKMDLLLKLVRENA